MILSYSRNYVASSKRRKLRKKLKRFNTTINGKKQYIGIKSDKFYDSRDWLELRYDVLRKYGRRCMCCGATPKDGISIHVYHIKPRAKYPNLALDFNNLQVLCELCNKGKRHRDNTDFRDKVYVR